MPLITGSSYQEMPAWLRNYAREAATAARNLGVNVQPPAPDSPEGTPPIVTPAPYVPYRGDRFVTRNVGGRLLPTTALEQRAIDLSQLQNPLVSAIGDASRYSGLAEASFPDSYQEYFNPYTDGLLDQVYEQGRRKLNEEVSPALEAKYVRLGQHGGRSHQKSAAKAARDIQSGISTMQADTLENAYTQVEKGFAQDRARSLEAAQMRGDVGNLSNLAKQGDMQAMFQAGAYMRALQERPMQAAEEEFRREQKHPYDSLNFLVSALNGVPVNSVMRDSTNIPPAPTPPRSLHSSDYMGMLAQLAPMMRRGR